MKKTLTITLALALFAAVGPLALYAIPPSVQEARRNAQAQRLVTGVGEARHANATVSRNAATLAARGEIARELDVIINSAQVLHMVAFEVYERCSITLSFFEDITTSIAESRLLGSTVIYEHREPDGRQWVVMALSRDSAIAELAAAAESAAAVAASAAAAPAPANPVQLSPMELGRLSAMDALRRMDEALELHFRSAD